MTLVHEIRPAAGEPQGALVLLHGRGTDQHDLFGLLDALDPDRRLLGVTPGAPLTNVPPGGRHWYLVPRVGYPDRESFHGSLAQLTAFLDRFLADHGLAWERTVVGGFSMGCVMSYASTLGAGRPSPAGIVGMSGFVPVVDDWAPALEDRAGLPVLIHHGRQDPVITVDFGRRAAQQLEAAGLDVRYLESDAGHWVPPELVPLAGEFVRAVTA